MSTEPQASRTRTLVERRAREMGLGAVRFTDLQPTPNMSVFRDWIAQGHHADMAWLERGASVRANPTARLPSARSVAVFAVEHHHRRPPDPGGRTGMVARYAWGRDYHNLMGKRLRRLSRALRRDGIESWGGVDAAPILERAWAQIAGVGFTGKNGVQLLPGRTSWLLLAVLFLDAQVTPDPPLERDHCGRCRRCLDACPTDAFVGERVVNARLCISYWTIEAKGLPPASLRPGFGRWVFGCDVCQEVCPHNHAPPEPEEDDLRPRHAWLDLDDILHTPDEVLEERYRGTPLRRPGGVGLKRNALLVLANLRDPGGIPAARVGLAHPSPVVRAAAVWCLRCLGADELLADLRDDDALVRAELTRKQAAEPDPG